MLTLTRKLLKTMSFYLMIICILNLCSFPAFTEEVTQHTIVSLVPLSGWISPLGQSSAAAARMAAEDVNAWLLQEGKPWRLKLVVEDTQSEPQVALQKVRHWSGQGVQFFTGPQSSGEIRECLSFANANRVLLVSPSSTLPALAIADDWLFRFCASDDAQGPAIARLAKAKDLEHLIFAWRGDDWGDALMVATAAAAAKLSIETYPEVRYAPEPGKNYTDQAAALNSCVTGLVDQGVDIHKIGICTITTNEIESILAAASAFERLKEVAWLGSDAVAGSPFSSTLNPAAAQFAAATDFVCLMPRPGTGPKYEHARRQLLNRLGKEPDQSAYIVYDIIWSLAMAIDQYGYDSAAVREKLPRVAYKWTKKSSAGGHVVLNKFGDRRFADYGLLLVSGNRQIGWYDGRKLARYYRYYSNKSRALHKKTAGGDKLVPVLTG
jgi:branched-chain amino acid transport system substrate-binding protein